MKNYKRVWTIKNLFLVAFAGLVLFSCRGRKHGQIAKVKPEKVSISGELGNYLEVIGGDYEISGDWGGKLSIKVKSKAKAPDSLLKDRDIKLNLSLLGDNAMPVSGVQDFALEYPSIEKVKSLLSQKSNEEILLFTGGFGYDSNKDADRVKTFTVSSSLTETPSSTGSTSNESSTENVSNNSGSQNWDKILDDYEAYVNDYVKFYKKAKDGDQSALVEYPSMMEKAVNLEKSLKKAQDDNSLSTEQATRLLKIQTKMVAGMSK